MNLPQRIFVLTALLLASRVVLHAANTPKLLVPELSATVRPDPTWTAQAAEDAKQDFNSIPYDGITPNKLVCDTTLRELPDGSWALFMLAGDDFEPSPKNYTGLTRSFDKGRTWTPLQAVDIGLPREGKTMGQGPTELMSISNRSTLFFSTHSQTWGRDWQSWFIRSDDNCKSWSPPQPVPGRLAKFTFIRNHIVTRDGRILLPFQHYKGPPAGTPPPPPEEKPWHKSLFHYVSNPRNGVLISSDGGQTWTEHGNIRLTPDDRYHGWAENNIAELGDGRIAMIIRADRLGGVLYYAESKDGGKTWPEFAVKSDLPNPGSKATLYPLGGDAVALLHNPNPKGRHPLAWWISFDGMKTWPYQRVLVKDSSDGPGRAMNYPDGFISKDKQWLHFAYDDNRHRAVHYSAKLPPLAMLQAGDAPKVSAAVENDVRLHADGKGWRLDQARITDPKRPRVLLIGDSILNGYLKRATALLDGKAYVDTWVNPYCQSEHLNKILLPQVLANGPYDVVHFNMGLHGWQEGRIKPDTFEPLTKAYVEVIKTKLPKAKLIWASSTPVTKEKQPAELEPDINPIIIEHNRMAAIVMAEMNVPVNDFYALLVNKRELARGDRFHWTTPAYELLAKTLAESVLRELDKAKGITP